ncbi:diol dehydratase small subunit [Agrobacterium sp. NPDC090283]|uniref:diol dehydratase small subunit n=1 Tax=Agrobacterium sp. NPDC090283 TaxID=3363920 RepID=UPI00383ABE40
MKKFAYPLSEEAPENVRTAQGKTLAELTLESILSGEVKQQDFAITPEVLFHQANVARASGRERLAENFERAAEMINVPNGMLIETYELLRPGRASTAEVLFERARLFREQFGAERMAAFIEEAARAYERRSLFRARY